MNRSLRMVLVLTLMAVLAVRCTPEQPIDNGDTVDEHEYVDLGLPSGVLWATCNVGAESPEAFGDYFAWAETQPKAVYDWKSYRYGDFCIERYDLTKYCTDSLYGADGFADYKSILEPEDDAATVNWGEEWRTPTSEEWEELMQYTSAVRTTLNDVGGWLLTADNGNAIFLPAAGYWWDDILNAAGIGVYWSSLVNKDSPCRAWGFHFNWDQCHICGSSDRNRGQTVRAVRSAK